jgi:hypothetical protein
MNWNELGSFWRGQQLPALPPAELVRQTFEADRQHRERLRFRRDVLEAVTGLILFGFLAYTAWRMKKSAGMLELAMLFILVPIAVYVRERIRSSRKRLAADAPLLARVDSEIAELRHQRRLWLNVGVWYLAPLAIAMTLGWCAVTLNAPPGFPGALFRDPSARIYVVLYVLVLVAALGWAWVRIRRDAVRNTEPRLAQLEQLRREILGQTS